VLNPSQTLLITSVEKKEKGKTEEKVEKEVKGTLRARNGVWKALPNRSSLFPYLFFCFLLLFLLFFLFFSSNLRRGGTNRGNTKRTQHKEERRPWSRNAAPRWNSNLVRR
jgi:hypothetical protein